MTLCAFAIPGDLATPTGGYVYARKILPLLVERLRIEVCQLPAGFPLASEAELEEAAVALAAHDTPGTVFFIDGLAYGALPASALQLLKAPLVALVHHPLGLEEGLTPSEKSHLLKTEEEALALAGHIVAPSHGTARELMQLFGVAARKITIAEPGILRGKRAKGAPAGAPPHIVSVGTMTPRKGHVLLIDALSRVRDLPWRATIAGSLDRSQETTALVRRKLTEYGLEERVRLAGQLDEAALSSLYSSADIFALASFYEGYGMAFAEAMAHGLPVVASGEGAVRDTVPASAGFICAAGDSAAFAEALRVLLSNASLRKEKAEGAWRHGRTLPDWAHTAGTIAHVLKQAAR
jgi:glycosyltransferase involved in cell wall biosynthesis